MNNYTQEQIKDMIVNNVLIPSLKKLYASDYDNIRFGVSERNICARLAHHMENLMRQGEFSDLFDHYYADVEYNRMGYGDFKFYMNSKRDQQYMVSDLVVHSRGKMTNLLSIEMKRKGNYKKSKEDKIRLMSIVSSLESKPFYCVSETLVGAYITYSDKDVKIEIFEAIKGKGKKTGEFKFLCKQVGDKFMLLQG